MNSFQVAGATIDRDREALADAIYARQRQIQPELEQRYDAAGHAKSRRDTGYHLAYLVESLQIARPILFEDYIAWTRSVLQDYGIPAEDLRGNLIAAQQVLQEQLPADLYAGVDAVLKAAVARVEGRRTTMPSYIDSANPHSELAGQYLDALVQGKRSAASNLILEAVAAGVPIPDIYLHVFQPTQYEIGRLWQTNQISVAHEHFATAVTQVVMSLLYPYIFDTPKHGRRLVATCVADELHEMGVRMVADFFEMDGWDTFYLGANTPTAAIIRMIEEQAADVLAISATMTLHVNDVTRMIADVRKAVDVKILVGGYPFNLAPDLWQAVGADGFAPNAQGAIAAAAMLA